MGITASSPSYDWTRQVRTWGRWNSSSLLFVSQSCLASAWFGPGNIPPCGHSLIWWKTTAHGVSKQPRRALPLFPLSYAQCLSFSQGMCRGAGGTRSTPHEVLTPGGAGRQGSLLKERCFGSRNDPLRTDPSVNKSLQLSSFIPIHLLYISIIYIYIIQIVLQIYIIYIIYI